MYANADDKNFKERIWRESQPSGDKNTRVLRPILFIIINISSHRQTEG